MPRKESVTKKSSDLRLKTRPGQSVVRSSSVSQPNPKSSAAPLSTKAVKTTTSKGAGPAYDDYRQFPIDDVVEALQIAYPTHPMSEITQCDPFKVLIACIMSLRTKDSTTFPLAEAWFKTIDTPQKMAQLPVKAIEEAIYPVGFYKTKAKNIKLMCQRLVDEFDSRVPDDIETLLTFTGVGRKTANLVVGLGYDKPAICVDTHVHRIFNRLGYLKTKTPDETEMVLRQQLPEPYWNIINRVLVCHGQQCCAPISPFCSRCPIETHCPRLGVGKTR